ncbi:MULTISPECIES: glycosyl hydrolase family 95 catalytic domain-containing protein [unclassified Sphingobacterium]|uniref:glycoside hydrolase family 95 protein n=1 Tax=unclassified Sphingobacterium TaxID=2609468 RepID=UPI0010507C1E|nr:MULTISPECIES: glycoside hydrolase family 95 protein [unclassified Sphingobacterium]MCS3556814.1 alpha-L-fucosidase 2 [Sphingobacterium sp. JUb21]TCQ99260.1 alpha-L-fucosidase 2 [Sphingobacterium sp. JUb20]
MFSTKLIPYFTSVKVWLSFLLFFMIVVDVRAQHQDHVLWYKEPAKNWNEALPVGNGRLGAMVFGDYNKETIQLNEESLWAGTKQDANADAAKKLPEIQALLIAGEIEKAAALSEKYLKSDPLRIRSYQSFGELQIDFANERYKPEQITDYRRELDIQSGITTVHYQLNGVQYKREVFASAPDNVIVIRLTADKPGKLTFRLSYGREQDATAMPQSEKELRIQGQIADLPHKDASEPGLHMKFAGLMRGVNKGGSLVATANSFFVKDADEVLIYFTAATDYNFSILNYDRTIDPFLRCQEIIDKVKNLPFDEAEKRHVMDHRKLFDRVVFNMGAPSMLPTNERLKMVKGGQLDLSLISLYFQYGRYLLMGSSRAPGVLPANLQGIWNQDMNAPWSSDFHTNINIQMNYWPAEVCNLSETVIPFSNFISALREPGRVTARKTYNASGWTMNHLTDLFGRTAITDGVGWGTFPIAASWLVLHQWDHYLFSKDKEYLRKEAYPTMQEAAQFMLDYLVEDKNGNLVTAPSNSPENQYRMADGKQFMLTYGATMDVQIINELFQACVEAETILGQKSDFSDRLKAAMKKLPPIKISPRYNTIQEWIEDYEEVEPGHRHISHLFGLYPGKSINANDPKIFEAARRTIARRRFYNENEGNRMGSYTGWSRAWMINFYARLLDGDEAGKNVQELLAKTTLDNLFNTHPPFQIDGNFGGTAGIAEMLIQSHNQEIHLLPALPPTWATGEMKGLRARNGLVVDMKWENGVLTSATLYAIETKKVTVRYNNKIKTMKVTANKPLIVQL